MSRAFNIQINVGDLDHELISLSDADLASWTRGFQLGLHGKDFPMGGGSSMYCGYAFGIRSYERAKVFMEKSAAGGRVSAARREAKYGTSKPKREAKCEAPSEAPSRLASEANTEQTRNQKPETSNEQPEASNEDTPAASLASLKKSGAHMTRKGVSIACEWESILEVYPLDRVKHALSKKAPKDKWPSQVRSVLAFEDSGGTLDEVVESPEDTMAFLRDIGVAK